MLLGESADRLPLRLSTWPEACLEGGAKPGPAPAGPGVGVGNATTHWKQPGWNATVELVNKPGESAGTHARSAGVPVPRPCWLHAVEAWLSKL